MLTPNEHVPRSRAELEAIVAALRVHELALLVALGRGTLHKNDAAGSAVERPGYERL